MANELEVEASGLRAAAASSDAAAAELSTSSVEGVPGTTPSHAGVAAIMAAAQSVRGRQSGRISGQASDLTVSGASYDTIDSDGADAITTVSV
ncbi:hypothetical protein ACRCUN_06175 [Mycobacterium sp. LTG2003]